MLQTGKLIKFLEPLARSLELMKSGETKLKTAWWTEGGR
jgi:hypothetical protein